MAMAIGLGALALLILVMSRAVPRRAPEGPAHPESLTAVLAPDDEEYLAWLADHHWPRDEYLDLEHRWSQEERPDPADVPLCPHCRVHDEDVWPCPRCGRMLHPSCGHGLRLRPVEQLYWTRGANSEPVVGEWLCTGCASVVGLDVGTHGGGHGGGHGHGGRHAGGHGADRDGSEDDDRLR